MSQYKAFDQKYNMKTDIKYWADDETRGTGGTTGTASIISAS